MVAKETTKSAKKKPQKTEPERTKKWFVFWTLSGREAKVKRLLEQIIEEQHLKEKVGRILVPMQTIPKVKGGKRVIQEKPIFKGYILVEMEPDPEVIEKLTATGSLRALIAKNTMITLSDEEVQRILETVEREREKKEREVPFLKGEKVKIVDGAFAEFVGEVEEVYPERGQLKVKVNIFGRSTPVILNFLQVERQ